MSIRLGSRNAGRTRHRSPPLASYTSDVLTGGYAMRMLAAGAVLIVGAALLTGAPAGAHERTSPWAVRAPGGGPVATLGLDPAAGTVTLAVSRAGRPVLDPGPVGIVTERADLSRG